ncbi:histone H1-like [Amphiura filiformis]|uniref:histone H1-like n=1 Tax=Amphiura filiformis TaxID=82378 RepID=UPI003B2102B7
MADTEAPPAAPAAKAKKTAKPKKKSSPATHPPCSEMIVAAITNLKDRNGSSLQAIKKYIGANYKCDVDKLSSHIRKALKSGVSNGKLVQTKGKGASGSFKVSTAAKPAKKAAKKKPAAKKPAKKAAKPKKAAKKPAAKKAKKTKKSAEKKAKKAKKPAAKKPAAKKPAKKAKKPAAKKAKKAAKK